MLALAFSDVSFCYNASAFSLANVSFEIRAGEFVSIVGRSGAGKTTLLRLAAGLLRPMTGSVKWSDREALKLEAPPIGFVFQDFGLFPWLNAFENVAFGLRRNSTPESELVGRVSHLLDVFGLANAGDRYPHQLSGGMKQRVAVARAIAQRPRMLCLDEPFSSLDPFLRKDAQDILVRALKENPMTTLMVTHDLEEAISLSDRIIIMRSPDSRVVGQNDVAWFQMVDKSNMAVNKNLLSAEIVKCTSMSTEAAA